jgi:hypothetical protein
MLASVRGAFRLGISAVHSRRVHTVA